MTGHSTILYGSIDPLKTCWQEARQKLKKDPTLQFFSALEQSSSELVGAESAVTRAARNAAQTPGPAAFVRAQEELAKLSDDLRDDVLRNVHARMRNDVEVIWDNLPGAPESSRPN